MRDGVRVTRVKIFQIGYSDRRSCTELKRALHGYLAWLTEEDRWAFFGIRA